MMLRSVQQSVSFGQPNIVAIASCHGAFRRYNSSSLHNTSALLCVRARCHLRRRQPVLP